MNLRIMERTDVIGQGQGVPHPIWQGTPAELARAYPVRRWPQDILDSFSNDDFARHNWLERQVGTNWVRCNDPRPKNR